MTVEAGEPAPIATAVAGCIDKDMLARLQNSHPALFTRLIETYLRYAPELMSQLTAAAACNNHQLLRTMAHSLKSSSANVGATRLAEGCRELEHALNANPQADAPVLQPMVSGVEHDMAAALKELQAMTAAAHQRATVDAGEARSLDNRVRRLAAE